MRRLVTFLIGFFLIMCMISCGQRFHLKKYVNLKEKADKHLALAIAKGAKVKTDTLYKSLNIEVPGINLSFPFKPIQKGVDTVYYDRDGVEVKIVYKRDQAGNVTAAQPIVKTETKYIEKRVPYEVKTEVKCDPPARGKWYFYGLISGAILVIGGYFLIKVVL